MSWQEIQANITVPQTTPVSTTTSPIITPTPFVHSLNEIPQTHIVGELSHSYQTFNNCGPASLSMALSAYGISISQQEIGKELRPWQNSQGDNDDKSVTLEELAEKSKDFGLVPYLRPNGNFDLLKQFIANDIVIVTRTLLEEGDDIGHYRVLYGYSDINQTILQNDSMDGKALEFTYDHFNRLWKPYRYEYLALVPKEKVKIAETILGEEVDEKIAWGNSVRTLTSELSKNPSDNFLRFSLSVAYYHTGDYQKSVSEFEKVEPQLSFRTLWYQIEPIQAYYELGNYDRVFQITDKILNNQNRAFSELYILRGDIYKNQGNLEAARSEYEKAVYYNENLKAAKEALKSVS